MDASPLSPGGFPVELQALLGLKASPTEAQVKAALARLIGQDLALLLVAQGPEGKTFRLPSGAALVAQGEFPYPLGTTVTVRVNPPSPGDTAPRLVPSEIQLPPPPPVLAALLQGEAAPLLAALTRPDPPAALAPLAALFTLLAAPQAPPTPGPPPRPGEPPLPPEAQIPLARLLQAEAPPEPLPAQVARWAAQARPLPPGTPEPIRAALAQALQRPETLVSWPRELGDAVQRTLARALPPEPLGAQARRWLALPDLPEPVARILEAVPAPLQAEVRAVLRQVLQETPAPTAPGPPPPTEGKGPAPAPSIPAPVPATAPILRAVEALPTPLRGALGRALGLAFPPGRPPSPPALAQALLDPTLPAHGPLAPPALEPPPLGVAPATWAALPQPIRQALQGAWRTAEPASVAPPPEERLDAPAPPPADADHPRLTVWLGTLPRPLQAQLASLVPATPGSDWTEALIRWVRQESPPGAAERFPSLPRPPQEALPLPPWVTRAVAGLPLPKELKDALLTWLRALHPQHPGEGSRTDAPPPRTEAPRPLPQPVPAPPAAASPGTAALPLTEASAARLTARLADPAPALAAHPEPWEAWVEASLRTLADPAASPREAPFHALQGLDRTACFELPLPWSPQHPLQVWAEGEAAPPPPGQAPTQRVLLGLTFTRLGETRVGLERSGTALAVRIWAEHPEPVAPVEARIRRELEALGLQVSLQVRPLPPRSPGPRAYAVGSGWGGVV